MSTAKKAKREPQSRCLVEWKWDPNRVQPIAHLTREAAEAECQELTETMYGERYEVVEYRRVSRQRAKGGGKK